MVEYGRASFLYNTTEKIRKKGPPRPRTARRNLQLYRKKRAASAGQTASWPVNNVAK
ncbi:hypothetical protein ALC62_00272 [Cyphomyrmex costatus]|uniref:Uncharacterized protein n=1 Tax=Cyphomyrmex costatus TaxID=456900 RepID=A0A195D7G3_9HYME|nr:hypothetical protein ALC62_00272 [Cyphomyrmex costatus]